MKLKSPLACFLLSITIPTVIARALYMQKNDKSMQVKTSSSNLGADSNGFQLSAEIDRARFQLGAPILLKLTVKNVSRRTLKLNVTYPESDYNVIIKDEKGEIVPPT